MSAEWNRCGNMSEKPALEMTASEARREVLKLRLRVVILQREVERGRPLTAAEQVANFGGMIQPMTTPPTQDEARALADAGYMPVETYIRMCRERGWANEQI